MVLPLRTTWQGNAGSRSRIGELVPRGGQQQRIHSACCDVTPTAESAARNPPRTLPALPLHGPPQATSRPIPPPIELGAPRFLPPAVGFSSKPPILVMSPSSHSLPFVACQPVFCFVASVRGGFCVLFLIWVALLLVPRGWNLLLSFSRCCIL